MCNERGCAGGIVAEERRSREILDAFEAESISPKCRRELWRAFKEIIRKRSGEGWPKYDYIARFVDDADTYPRSKTMVAIALDGLRLFRKLYVNSRDFTGLLHQCKLLDRASNSAVRKAKLGLFKIAIKNLEKMPTAVRQQQCEDSLSYILSDDEVDSDVRACVWGVLKNSELAAHKLRGVCSDEYLPIKVRIEAFEKYLRNYQGEVRRFVDAPWYTPGTRIPKGFLKKVATLDAKMDKMKL